MCVVIMCYSCFYICVHGKCFGPPTYQCLCHVGWTGVDCHTDCGCHNHSSCVTGVGQCDECDQWTTGSHCERCKPGSFGDATTTQSEQLSSRVMKPSLTVNMLSFRIRSRNVVIQLTVCQQNSVLFDYTN